MSKTILQKRYFFEIPDDWQTELGEIVSVYNAEGYGAMSISAYSVLNNDQYSLGERISIMAKQYIQNHGICIEGSLILTNKGKCMVHGEGKTPDNWYVKIWIVAKNPRIVVATYYSQKINKKEIKICDRIIDSIGFTE